MGLIGEEDRRGRGQWKRTRRGGEGMRGERG